MAHAIEVLFREKKLLPRVGLVLIGRIVLQLEPVPSCGGGDVTVMRESRASLAVISTGYPSTDPVVYIIAIVGFYKIIDTPLPNEA
jgi:hypothetical protein